jgi:hypothetical protein
MRVLASMAWRPVPEDPSRVLALFKGVPAGSARRGFADLENRQRRKSFVGSNPTPSVWVFASSRRGSFLSAIPGFVVSGSESLRAFAALACFAFCFALDRASALGFAGASSSSEALDRFAAAAMSELA